MKITNKNLRRIIREETAKIIKEGPDVPDIMGAIGGGKFEPREQIPDRHDIESAVLLMFRENGMCTRAAIRSRLQDDGYSSAAIDSAIDDYMSTSRRLPGL